MKKDKMILASGKKGMKARIQLLLLLYGYNRQLCIRKQNLHYIRYSLVNEHRTYIVQCYR